MLTACCKQQTAAWRLFVVAVVCRVGQCDTRPDSTCSKPTDAGVFTDVWSCSAVPDTGAANRPSCAALRGGGGGVIRRGVCCSDACLLALCRPVLPTAVCGPFHAGPVAGLPVGGCAVPCAQRQLVHQLWLDLLGCSVAAGLWCHSHNQSLPGLVQWCVAMTAPVLTCAVVVCVDACAVLCGGHQSLCVGNGIWSTCSTGWAGVTAAAAALVLSGSSSPRGQLYTTHSYSTVDTQRAAACCSQ